MRFARGLFNLRVARSASKMVGGGGANFRKECKAQIDPRKKGNAVGSLTKVWKEMLIVIACLETAFHLGKREQHSAHVITTGIIWEPLDFAMSEDEGYF